MTRYLYAALFLLLLVFCASCGAASTDTADINVELFQPGEINVSKEVGYVAENLDIGKLFSPSLLGANGVLVALAEVRETNEKHDILAKLIGTEETDWKKETIKEKGKNLRTYLAFRNDTGNFVAFAPVAKNDTVYILSAGKVGSASSFQESSNSNGWDFKLTVGKITDSSDGTGKIIEWNTKEAPGTSVNSIQSKLKNVSPHLGSAFSMEDGTFVFVLKTRRIIGKDAFVIAHSNDLNKDLTLRVAENTADCIYAFFPWDKKLFMVPKRCSDAREYKVQMSDNMGKNWKEATGPLAARLNKVKTGRDSFTSIDLDGKRVLLFTEPKSTSDASSKKVLNLFMAYGNEVEEIGLIVTNAMGVSGGSFVYTNDKLFFLSLQETDEYVDKIILTRLDKKIEEKLRKIKEQLKK